MLYREAGDDSLSGGSGVDYLIGGAGDDTLDGGEGTDALYGEVGNDSVYGGPGYFIDILTGGDGDDTLDGGEGVDRMAGGPGNDVYYVDQRGDLIFEADGGGHDVVYAAIANGGGFQLWPYVEDLFLLGSTGWGWGNRWDNLVVGNDLANSLNGWGGSDTIIGGRGNDVLYGGGGADQFVFHPGDGRDVLADFTPRLDKIRLEGFGYAGVDQVLAAARQVDTRMVIDLAPGDSLTFLNIKKAALSAGDFILA